ncbi:dihydroorotase, partial [Staphylococcus aureus]
IATDHAPHAADEKNQPMTKAPFGIVGSETAFPLLYTRFVKNGDWTLGQLIDYLALKPGQVFGLPYGKSLEVGSIADIAVIDLDEKYEIKSEDF